MSVLLAVAGSRGSAELQAGRGPGESDSRRWDPSSTTEQACEEATVLTFQDSVSSWVKWVMVMSTPRAGTHGTLLTEQSAQGLVTECSGDGEMSCDSGGGRPR